MFERLEMAPADPILGLNDAFKKDSNPDKINLGVGVFQDESGTTPTLAAVTAAERRLSEQGGSKTYLPILGSEGYARCVRGLLFGQGHELEDSPRAVTAQTPGGTGALCVGAGLLHDKLGVKKVWISNPSWANHRAVFEAVGMEVASYPYYDATARGVAFDSLLEVLGEVPAGEAVLLHACCHNPTGFDLSLDQWKQVLAVAQRQGWVPFFDFAYQGFGDGLDADAGAIRLFADAGLELLVASSFSKNFGLYNERVGALTALSADAEVTARLTSQLKLVARTTYSNPPRHGAAVVETILGDAKLAQQWRDELEGMRLRIHGLRTRFVQGLAKAGVSQDFSFLERQHGMFSFSGLSGEQVDRLRQEHSIYAVRSGRINVAGLREATLERVCQAVASVL